MRLIHLDTIARKVSLSTLSPPMDSSTWRSGFLDLDWFKHNDKNELKMQTSPTWEFPDLMRVGLKVWLDCPHQWEHFYKAGGSRDKDQCCVGTFYPRSSKKPARKKKPSGKWIIVKITRCTFFPDCGKLSGQPPEKILFVWIKCSFRFKIRGLQGRHVKQVSHGKYLRNMQIWILPCASRGRLASEIRRNGLYIFFVSSHLK